MKLIDNKLEENADWFLGDKLKIYYITGRLAGNPAINILPYLNPDNPEYIDIVLKLKTYLKATYNNPDRRRKAQVEWEGLRIYLPDSYKSKTVDYKLFKLAFTRLAVELKKNKLDWNNEFK